MSMRERKRAEAKERERQIDYCSVYFWMEMNIQIKSKKLQKKDGMNISIWSDRQQIANPLQITK